MRVRGTGAATLILGSLLSFSGPLNAQPIQASSAQDGSSAAAASSQATVASRRAWMQVAARARGASKGRRYASTSGGGISCVPFARRDSGISVPGNAWQWWDNAAGVYTRGSVPEARSVLAFRSNGRMRLGHVAVVSRVINPREIEIEHANWSSFGMRGGIARNIPVVDVSEANDWSAVRVGLGRSGEFGSVYPTYGFIYDRPDTGTLVAAASAPAPKPDLNPAPSDLRPVTERGWQVYEEVAEAPGVSKRRYHRGVDLSLAQSLLAPAAVDRKR
jgi:surface antigen